jgi:heat shock protein HslJ
MAIKMMFRALQTGLLVTLVAGCSYLPQINFETDISGDWKVEAIKEIAVIEDSQASLGFEPDYRLAGNASCNRYFGSYEVKGDSLSISDLGATMMMCSEELMDQEGRFLRAMGQVSHFDLTDKGLFLKDEQGRELIRATLNSQK